MFPVLIAMSAGMIAGFLLKGHSFLFRLLDPATAWIVRLLLFLLGYGIGVDRELVTQIPVLGMKGLVLAIAAIIGSVLAAGILIGRPGAGQFGDIRSGDQSPEQAQGAPGDSAELWKAVRGSLIAAAAFLLGLPAGLFLPLPMVLTFDPASLVLYLLMFLVGIGAGADSTALIMIRKYGLKLLLLPIAVIAGTFTGCLAVALIWPSLPIRESLAVGAGFGYYSLSSLVIRELSGGDWAAVALLSNIAREIITLLLAPILVRLAGPAAPPAAGGATSMDTTLAATVQSSGRAWAVPALFSGVVLTVLTPFAVTFVLTI